MYRVGIIGAENSHALAFAKLFNMGKNHNGTPRYRDVRVTGVFGPDASAAEQIREEAETEYIASSPEEFLGKTDAMMITSRKGSEHLKYALPFIKAGMPVFVDKPVTADIDEIRRLVAEAMKSGSPVMGGSGCKYAYDVLLLQKKAQEWRREGKLLGGAVNFSADPESEYDGFYFYASHLTEIALTIFGYDMKSVAAFEESGTITAVAHYETFHITMHYTKNSRQSTAVIYGSDGNECRNIDISLIYQHETDRFAEMLRTKEMPSCWEELTKPVFVISAVLESLQSRKECRIEELQRGNTADL